MVFQDPLYPMISNNAIISAINYINTLRSSNHETQALEKVERVFDLLFSASHNLAAYGSLMPGRENHHLISEIEGTWETGMVLGHFYDGGWGAGLGYPSIVWEPAGEEIPVHVLVSKNLTNYWDQLDHFEGEDYHRILVPVYRRREIRWVANIYESAIKSRD